MCVCVCREYNKHFAKKKRNNKEKKFILSWQPMGNIIPLVIYFLIKLVWVMIIIMVNRINRDL